MSKIVTFNKTVQGHLHIRKNVECQDASISFSEEDGRYYIAIISDGHGDSACLRSARGSKFVVDIAKNALIDFAELILDENGDLKPEYVADMESPTQRKYRIKQITDIIVSKWYQAISDDLSNDPLTEEDFEKVGDWSDAYRSGKRLEHIYGATLIAALRIKDYMILIQQGDGRCDVFYADATVDQPIPWDDRCHENVTTSMCDDDVATSFRHCIINLVENNVIACYVGSDGVEDSFRSMEGTHSFYRKITVDLFEKGTNDLEGYLAEFLPSFSESGSGDDVSIAGIVDIDAVEPYIDTFRTNSKRYDITEEIYSLEQRYNSMQRKHSILKKRAEEAKKALEDSLKSHNIHKEKIVAITSEIEKTENALQDAQITVDETKVHAEEIFEYMEKQQEDIFLNLSKRCLVDSESIITYVREKVHEQIEKVKMNYEQTKDKLIGKSEELKSEQALSESISAEVDNLKLVYEAALKEFTEYDNEYKRIAEEIKRLQALLDTM